MQAWEWALELRTELLEWWQSDIGRRFSMGWTASRSVYNAFDANEQVGVTEFLKLSIASPFYVTAEMTDLLEHAAKTFPATPLQPQDLPTDCGFVYLARDIDVLDINNKPLPFRAFAWGLAGSQTNPEQSVGIHLSLYAHKDNDPGREIAEQVHGLHPTLAFNHETGWNFGGDYSAQDRWVSGTIGGEDKVATPEIVEENLRILRTIHCFFLLVQQRVGIPDTLQAGRQTRRRAQRAFPHRPIPDVRVITLRRPRVKPDGMPDRPGSIEYSHRWWVNSHWRRQWYESEGRHKPKFIEGYVKGPEDKPFQAKDTAYIWRR